MPATVHVQDFNNLTEEFYIQQRKVKLERNEEEFLCEVESFSVRFV